MFNFPSSFLNVWNTVIIAIWISLSTNSVTHVIPGLVSIYWPLFSLASFSVHLETSYWMQLLWALLTGGWLFLYTCKYSWALSRMRLVTWEWFDLSVLLSSFVRWDQSSIWSGPILPSGEAKPLWVLSLCSVSSGLLLWLVGLCGPGGWSPNQAQLAS